MMLLTLATDCGRVTGKPEVIPEDPVRAITSGLPFISGQYF